MAHALWVLPLLPDVIMLAPVLVILPEERYLEQKCGERYRSDETHVRHRL